MVPGLFPTTFLEFHSAESLVDDSADPGVMYAGVKLLQFLVYLLDPERLAVEVIEVDLIGVDLNQCSVPSILVRDDADIAEDILNGLLEVEDILPFEVDSAELGIGDHKELGEVELLEALDKLSE